MLPADTDSTLHLKPGVRALPEYELVNRLGRGGFGEVWSALGPGGVRVALKFIRLDSKAGQLELKALHTILPVRHAHLLSLHGAWTEHGYLILAQDLADETLLDRLMTCKQAGHAGIPPEELIKYLIDAAEGLDYLNQTVRIQHRDVKPQNLFLVGRSIKVADFGLVTVLEKSVTTTVGGMTPAFAAPEMFDGKVTTASDQYALAITYCQLRGGALPFEGTTAQIMAGHMFKTPDLSMLPTEPERTAVARALAKQPSERWPSCLAFAEAVRGQRPLSVPVALPPTLTPAPTPGPGPTSGADAVATQVLPPTVAVLQQELTNSIGIRLVWIRPGRFTMGSPADEPHRNDDETAHEVVITQGFYLGAYPVTQEQYERLTGSNPSRFSPWGGGATARGLDTQRFPVEQVSWLEAKAFCKKLTEKENQPGWEYRLPTEAEWEYACRAGTTTPFSFGKALNGKEANCNGNYPYGTTTQGMALERTSKVGDYRLNAWRLFDMHGNVWEWCEDWYGAYPAGAVADPQGPPRGWGRVIRGGSWNDVASKCRSAYRSYDSPDRRAPFLGFRIVRVATGGK